MERLLPEDITASYTRYKTSDRLVFSWITDTSNSHGYRTPRTHIPIDDVDHQEPGYKSKTTSKGASPGPITDETKNDSARYAMPTTEISDRVELIIGRGIQKASTVPPHILQLLRCSIADRESCSKWYRRHRTDDAAAQSTDAHNHFTKFLKQMVWRLEPFAASEVSPRKGAGAGADVSESIAMPALRFSVLNVAHPRGDRAESLNKEDVFAPHPPNLHTPTPTQKLYKAESTTTDMVLAISFLLDQLQELRQHNKTTWSEYRKGQTSLIQATILANTAIELARTLEEGFAADFPESPAWETLVESLFPRETALWKKLLSTFTQGDVEDLDRTFQLPTNMLKYFRDKYARFGILGIMKRYVPKVNRVYDAGKPNLDQLDAIERQKILMDNIMVELAMQASWGICHYGGDNVIAAFKGVLDSNKVSLWATFSFQLLCDIHVVLGDEFPKPFNDLKRMQANDRQRISTYVTNSENALLKVKMTTGITRREYEEKPIKFTGEPTIEDEMLVWRPAIVQPIKGFEYAAQVSKPFFLFNHHPMFAGSLAIASCLWRQSWATHLADDYRYITAAFHLYNALRQEGCVAEARDYFEHMEKVYGRERVFLGQPPSNAQAYEKHYLVVLGVSIQTFAANNNRLKKGRFIYNSETNRPRDLRELSPLLKMLHKQFKWGFLVPDVKLTDVKALLAAQKPLDPKQTQSEDDTDPIKLLAAYSDCLKEQRHRFEFNYHEAWHVCWKLLRRIEASPLVQTRFRRQWDIMDHNIDKKLHLLPLFIFQQHLDNLTDGTWMKSVGETVDKFFREEIPIDTLNKEPELKEVPKDDATEIMYAPDWEMDEPWHPTKDGKCSHVGQCELQVMHWRQQASLPPAADLREKVEEKENMADDETGEQEEATPAKKKNRRRKRRRTKKQQPSEENPTALGDAEATAEQNSSSEGDERTDPVATTGTGKQGEDKMIKAGMRPLHPKSHSGMEFKVPQGAFDLDIPCPTTTVPGPSPRTTEWKLQLVDKEEEEEEDGDGSDDGDESGDAYVTAEEGSGDEVFEDAVELNLSLSAS
ncbi:MAG: hypothetical protein Q9202_000396 [Teloschistes flavicans]